nr:MAG TPA: hypothetical protein [Caudoviricetes sp.]DAX33233.1 MAG TPA: hypothetical protein [Caudoviricetes sp.]DAY02271.1 MAG TPA: hypothetical protein [Caudoviricetes sp.]
MPIYLIYNFVSNYDLSNYVLKNINLKGKFYRSNTIL